MLDVDHVPSPSDVPQAEIAAAMTNFHEAAAARLAADRGLAQLERNGRTDAERKDAEATAAALSSGKADPGARSVLKFERALVDARRTAQANALIVERARRDLAAAVDKHGGELVRTVRERFERSRGEYVASLERAEALHAQMSDQFGLVEWTGGGRFRVASKYLPTIPAPPVGDGNRLPISAVFEALKNVGAEPTASRSGEQDQPLRAVS